MNRKILLQSEEIEYTLKEGSRGKSVRLVIDDVGSLFVTLPSGIHERVARNFIQKKADWILDNIGKMKREERHIVKARRKDIPYLKRQALRLATSRLSYFNETIYKYSYKKVRIKNPKSRWGSCSKKGNLNFNYKIALLPGALSDYIIVHELCHLKEFNHGRNFWNLVEQSIPDYKERRNSLKKVKISFT